MSFKLYSKNKIGHQIRKRARKQFKSIQDGLEDWKPDDVSVAHQVRARIKKIRCLSRLVRPSTEGKFFHRTNESLRKIADHFSRLRDLEVEIGLLERLKFGQLNSQTRASLSQLIKRLKHDQGRELKKIYQKRKKILRNVKQARKRAKLWPVGKLHLDDLKTGIKRAWCRYQDAFGQAILNSSDERLHRWRKRAKDLSQMLSLIQPICTGACMGGLGYWGQLAHILGNDHDIVLAQNAFRDHGPIATIQYTLEQQRGYLQKTALKLCGLIPKDEMLLDGRE